MSAAVPSSQSCVGCNRPRVEVSTLMKISKGGMPTYLCSDCIRDLAAIVAAAEPGVRPAYDRRVNLPVNTQ